jgi:hypothetical protein
MMEREKTSLSKRLIHKIQLANQNLIYFLQLHNSLTPIGLLEVE